jgi:hypothetical protein
LPQQAGVLPELPGVAKSSNTGISFRVTVDPSLKNSVRRS